MTASDNVTPFRPDFAAHRAPASAAPANSGRRREGHAGSIPLPPLGGSIAKEREYSRCAGKMPAQDCEGPRIENPRFCDRLLAVGSRTGSSGAARGSHATQGDPAVPPGAVVSRVVPLTAGQLALFDMAGKRRSWRARYRHVHTKEELAAFDRTLAVVAQIRGGLEEDERWCLCGCGKIIGRERRSCGRRWRATRCDRRGLPSFRVGDPFGAPDAYCELLRVGGKAAPGRLDVHG